VVFIAFAIQANAQVSRFLDYGKSGLGIQGTTAMGEGYYGFGGSLGGSINGKLDVELSYSYNTDLKDYHSLTTDKANYGYYAGKLTYWIFREAISPVVDVNFGVNGLVEYGSYKDYRYINSGTGLEREYKGFIGGTVGFDASVNFRMKNGWNLQPGLLVGFNFGNENETEGTTDFNYWYHGMESDLTLALIKRYSNGNAFYAMAHQAAWTYNTYFFYLISVGYIFAL